MVEVFFTKECFGNKAFHCLSVKCKKNPCIQLSGEWIKRSRIEQLIFLLIKASEYKLKIELKPEKKKAKFLF